MPSYDIATRAQALTLKLVGFSNSEIESITGIKQTTLSTLFRKTIARGFNPSESQKILDIHVQDRSRSGRPKKQTEDVITEVILKVRGDRFAREKICAQIAAEVGGISDITVWRILRASGFRKTKPTRKPALTEAMKKARLQFALDHKDWTIEDNMIEPAWPYLKRVTTKKGPLTSRAEAERVWRKAWEELEQWRIQQWIERILRHIEEIIKCQGDNTYREGKSDKARRFKAPLDE
jgi:transposase